MLLNSLILQCLVKEGLGLSMDSCSCCWIRASGTGWQLHSKVTRWPSKGNPSSSEACAAPHRMLDDLDEEVEGTHHRLAAAQKKMNNVLKKMGLRGQLCLIAFLIAILVLLIVLTIS